MKYMLSVLATAMLTAAVPAHATVYVVNFTGVVSQTIGATGESVGSTVTGHFDLDSTTSSFLDFTIAGQSVAPGYQSFASIGPAQTDAIYTAQLSPVSAGTPNNSTFSLDLSSLTNWLAADTAYTLLTDTTQLTTNLDTLNTPLSAFPSTFNYYMASATGANVTALDANLTSISAVTATPEPASFALLVSSLFGMALWARRPRA
jgi:hypothetical protein